MRPQRTPARALAAAARTGTIALATGLALALSLGACVEETPPRDPDALAGFAITIVDDSALGEAPFAFPSAFTPVTIRVEALDGAGERKSDYRGTVAVRIVPGEVQDSTRFVTLVDGVNGAHELRLRYSFGQSRIWAEEVGLDQQDECRDGFDNDGNGRLDYPGDPGCFGVEDPSEGGATYVTGVSSPLRFQPIHIHDVQFNPEDPRGESPLLGEEVKIEPVEGAEPLPLLVTNVTFSGLFVTDLAETEGYDSIFLFNFSFPEGVSLGDRLLWFSGGVDEFQGGTQLTFPSWEVDESYDLPDSERAIIATCGTSEDPDVLQPTITVLSSEDLADLETLERYESSVVRVENVRLTSTFMDCDFDDSGDISGDGEEDCRDVCQASNLCTELSNFRERDQFGGDVQGSAVYLSSAAQVAEIDGFDGCVLAEEFPPTYRCPQRVARSLTGNLRHVFLTTRIQLWEIIPRFACDIELQCESDSDCYDNQTCDGDTCI